MYFLTKKEIYNSFNKLKIKKGDCIFVLFETFRIGKIKNVHSSEEYFKIFFFEILKKIGTRGTLATNTYTFDNGRYSKNYQHLNKKCSSGRSSEVFLSLKNVSRSIHPLFSVAAIGKYRNFICKNNSTHNYGLSSPYDKLLKKKCKILSIGRLSHSNPFLHMAELVSGVPYYYNKIFKKKVYVGKTEIKKTFVSTVRYLKLGLQLNNEKINNLLIKKKILKKIKLGNGFITICESEKFYNTVIELLKKDVHGFLKCKPCYNLNDYPYR